MSYFAEVNQKGIVLRIIVADQSFIDSGALGNPKMWIETSYNTFEGKHKLGGVPLRGNYAGKGFTYDKGKDVFIPPKPYESWTYDEGNVTWTAPKDKPTDGREYDWDEEKKDWILESE